MAIAPSVKSTQSPTPLKDQLLVLREIQKVLQDIRAQTAYGVKSDGWYTNGLTTPTIAAANSILAVTGILQPGVYEWVLQLTNPEATSFSYDLQWVETDTSGSEGASIKSHRYTVAAGPITASPFFGFHTIRGRTVTRLRVINVLATTVAGHQASLYLMNVR